MCRSSNDLESHLMQVLRTPSSSLVDAVGRARVVLRDAASLIDRISWEYALAVPIELQDALRLHSQHVENLVDLVSAMVFPLQATGVQLTKTGDLND